MEPAKTNGPVEPRRCERCLETERVCICLPLDLEEYDAPEVVWVASRAIKPSSVIRREKKYRYERACKEVERLNRLYAGKVQHFLMPVS